MKLTIALNTANVATAGEQDFASLSASRVDAAKAKIGRLQELIKKTKSSKSYKTSERLKASVERRTKLLKETQAKLKELEKGAKSKPVKKAAAKKDKKPKVLVNKNGKLSKSAKQPAGVRSAQKRKIANRGKTAMKDHVGRTVRVHVKPKAGAEAKKSPKRKPKLD